MNGMIDDHFGHCEFYHVFTISNGIEIVDIQSMNSPQGCGCKSNIAQELREQGVSVMLAGGIGKGAINILSTNDIEVIRGCSGNARDVVEQYLSGTIRDSGVSCQHHDHDPVCSH